MGMESAQEHVDELYQALREMAQELQTTNTLFNHAYLQADAATNLLYENAAKILYEALVEGYSKGLQRFGEESSPAYIAALGHLRQSGILDVQIENEHAQNAARASMELEGLIQEFSEAHELLVAPVEELDGKLNNAKDYTNTMRVAIEDITGPSGKNDMVMLSVEIVTAMGRLARYDLGD